MQENLRADKSNGVFCTKLAEHVHIFDGLVEYSNSG